MSGSGVKGPRATVTTRKPPEPPKPPEGLHKLESGCHENQKPQPSPASDWIHMWHGESPRNPYKEAPQAEKNLGMGMANPPAPQMRKASKARSAAKIVKPGLKKPTR